MEYDPLWLFRQLLNFIGLDSPEAAACSPLFFRAGSRKWNDFKLIKALQASSQLSGP
jgi:hypothetical protein